MLADRALDPVCLLKADVRSELYRITLQPEDTQKLGLVPPSMDIGEDMVAMPLYLPMRF